MLLSDTHPFVLGRVRSLVRDLRLPLRRDILFTIRKYYVFYFYFKLVIHPDDSEEKFSKRPILPGNEY